MMNKTVFGVVLVALMFTGISISSFYAGMTELENEKMDLWERIGHARDNIIVSATDGESGSVSNGEDAIVNIYIYPHQANTNTYNSGLSEASAYEHFDNSFSNGEELEGETPYDTAFDIIIEMQYDKDHVYDSAWNTSRVWCYCNCSDLSISSSLMSESSAFFDTDTDDGKINFYLNNDDSGFTIGALEQINDIEFKPYAQY
jgi:hypothetical protein